VVVIKMVIKGESNLLLWIPFNRFGFSNNIQYKGYIISGSECESSEGLDCSLKIGKNDGGSFSERGRT
jgi:hypothetical protein